MASSSRKCQKLGPKIKHRTTTPTLALILPPPSMTQDDLYYGYFIKHLLEPFTGVVRGVKHPPPGIICGHIVFEIPKVSRSKGGNGKPPFECMKQIFRRFAWRCRRMAREIMDRLLKRNYLKDPADSVWNKRIVTEWSDDEME